MFIPITDDNKNIIVNKDSIISIIANTIPFLIDATEGWNIKIVCHKDLIFELQYKDRTVRDSVFYNLNSILVDIDKTTDRLSELEDTVSTICAPFEAELSDRSKDD